MSNQPNQPTSITQLLEADKDLPISPEVMADAFVQSLFQFFRLSELYDPSNAVFDRAIQNCVRVIDLIFKWNGESGVEFLVRGEKFYVNRMTIRPKPRQMYIFKYLLKFVVAKKISGFKIVSRPTFDHLKVLLWAAAKSTESNPSHQIMNFLQAQGIQEFVMETFQGVEAPRMGIQGGDLTDVELIVAGLYNRILKFAEICFDNLERASQFNLSPIQHTLNELMVLAEEDVTQMLRLISVKRHERPLPSRAANACFMMFAWARSFGLPTGILTELTGAALAHPLYLLAAESQDSQSSAEINFKTLELLERLKMVWPLSDIQRLSVLEWNLPFGTKGVYEVSEIKCYSNFFSRMVRIVATFEDLTTFIPGKRVYLPDEAIAEMIERKSDFDPTLLKLFVNWVGIYPVGSLVQLQSGEVAQVFAGAADPLKFQRPIVSVIKDNKGNLLSRPRILDLSEINPKLGIYMRSIKKSLTVEEAGIPNQYFQMRPIGLE